MKSGTDLPEHICHLNLLSLTESDTEEESELTATPIFNEAVRQFGHSMAKSPLSQYGLLGGDIAKISRQLPIDGLLPVENDPRIYYNVSTPSSVFVCGSQGSGKSHTLSCLLENCLLSSEANVLLRPLAGIVFHYDTFISDTGGAPCEAAYLSSHEGVKVRVLCPPTNTGQIKRIYSSLPKVKVEELRFDESNLNTKRMLDLMAASSTQGGGMPLYLHVVTRILRDLRITQQKTDGVFSYTAFKTALANEDLTPAQWSPLQQRLDTLESFIVKQQVQITSSTPKRKAFVEPPRRKGIDWSPRSGQLTIVDLSCPCVTAEAACALFNVCLSLFLEQDVNVGRVIALDEAHKYMINTPECATLTESLLATIRLQRHLGTRVFISTQEPTISPKLLDLCSITIVHRFTSPDWFRSLKKHLAGATALNQAANLAQETTDNNRTPQDCGSHSPELADIGMGLFSRIVALRTGEALLFAPSAIMQAPNLRQSSPGTSTETSSSSLTGSYGADISKSGLGTDTGFIRLNYGFMNIRIRKRITQDGGRTVMAV